jgi:polysaccharide export outer membrane protein
MIRVLLVTVLLGATLAAQSPVTPPPGYVIGTDDVLSVVFWRDKDLSTDATVRPDGHISLPLLNDIAVAGLTPEQARQRIATGAERYMEAPSVTVVVKQINSLKVYITGHVAKPGAYPLTGDMTVMQLIAVAGGLQEFTSGKKILVMRTEHGRPVAYRFNYQQVLDRKNLHQNLRLKPGDTVVVP